MQHAFYTGPIQGLVTLEDGTVVNVTPDVIEVAGQDQADELSFLIGEHWVKNGHPDDIDIDDDGTPVQRPFVHVHDKKFDKHPGKHKGKPAGTPHPKG
jgi:hypothetical protein